MSDNQSPRSTVAPKISKENMAYMITLAALCFSISQWSDAQECFQIILLFGGIVFGWLVFQSINSKQNNKKGERDA